MLIGEIRPIPLAKFKQLRVGEDERVLETAGGGSAILLRDLIGKAPAGADLLIRRLRQKLRRGHVGREPLLDARVAGESLLRHGDRHALVDRKSTRLNSSP